MFEKIEKKSKDDFIWRFKYAPDKISDIILLEKNKNRFEKIIEQKSIPDLLLYGPAGVGKTTLVQVLINELDLDVLSINGSRETSIDTIRLDVKNFTSRGSSKQKLVFIDECDRLSQNAQDALKVEMEDCKKTFFILTSNHKERIIDPIISRCGGGISFFYNSDEKKELQKKYFIRCKEILEKESVAYDDKAVAKIVQNRFPDMRNIIHDMQNVYQQFGKIDLIGVNSIVFNLDEFFLLIKQKNFDKIRNYIKNMNTDYKIVYSSIISKIENYVESGSIAEMINLIYEHDKSEGNPEIGLVHFCCECMNINLK